MFAIIIFRHATHNKLGTVMATTHTQHARHTITSQARWRKLIYPQQIGDINGDHPLIPVITVFTDHECSPSPSFCMPTQHARPHPSIHTRVKAEHIRSSRPWSTVSKFTHFFRTLQNSMHPSQSFCMPHTTQWGH